MEIPKTIDQQSKQQILKSTGILGSVQVFNILIGIIRIKVLALLLGPIGVGIAGIYQTAMLIIRSATGFGLNFSGVRDIAAAAATNDEETIAKTALVLKRWSLFTGLLGMLLTIIFCKPLSKLSFGDESYAWGIAIMSITLLLSAITGGLNALLQGMRKINEMAKANIVGAFIGLVGAIVIYYVWGYKGIVPALLFTFLIGQVVTWYYARRIRLPKINLSIRCTYQEGLSMARLGFFMVVTTLFNHGFMYIVRAFLLQKAGLESVGHFIAAWTISTMYISAIFGAMATDYFPRLSGIQNDNIATTKLVNDQSEIALLLTVPIIIGMISFVGFIVHLFYSKEFGATAEILNWQLLGDFVKVLGYPLGFVLLAKAKGKLVVITELLWNLFYLGFIYFGWDLFGIKISGIAFLIAYILNVAVVFLIVNKTIGYKWSSNLFRYVTFFLPLLIMAFLNTMIFEQAWQQYIFGFILTISASLFSYYQLRRVINMGVLMQKFKTKLAAVRAGF